MAFAARVAASIRGGTGGPRIGLGGCTPGWPVAPNVAFSVVPPEPPPPVLVPLQQGPPWPAVSGGEFGVNGVCRAVRGPDSGGTGRSKNRPGGLPGGLAGTT